MAIVAVIVTMPLPDSLKSVLSKYYKVFIVLVLLPNVVFAQYSHIVQPQETLFAIAKKYSLNHLSLAQSNQLDANYSLEKGQVIFLKRKASRLKHHMVRQGDTLYAISKAYGYSVANLATLNGLDSEYRLKKGQIVKFPDKNQNSATPLIKKKTASDNKNKMAAIKSPTNDAGKTMLPSKQKSRRRYVPPVIDLSEYQKPIRKKTQQKKAKTPEVAKKSLRKTENEGIEKKLSVIKKDERAVKKSVGSKQQEENNKPTEDIKSVANKSPLVADDKADKTMESADSGEQKKLVKEKVNYDDETKKDNTGKKNEPEPETKTIAETKPVVETGALTETKSAVESKPVKEIESATVIPKQPEINRVETEILAPQSTREFVKLIRAAKQDVISGARFILGKKQLKVLSLQQSLEMGKQKSLTIQQQQEQTAAAQHALTASEALLDPTLNMALTYSRSRQFTRSEFFTRERQVQTDTYIVPDALDRFEQALKQNFQQRLVSSGISAEQAEVIVSDVFASQAWQTIYGADKEPVAGSFRFEVEQILRNEVFGSDPGLLTQDIFERTITPAYEQFVSDIQAADIFPDFYHENGFNLAYYGQRNGDQRLDDSSSFLYDIEGAALSSAVVYDKTTVFDDEVLELEGIEIPTIIIDNAIVGGDGNCIAREGKVFIRNEENTRWIAADPENDLAYIKSFCGYSRSNYRREEFAAVDSPYVESYDLNLELEKDFWWGTQLKLSADTHKARPGLNLGNLFSALSTDSPFCLNEIDPSCLPGTFQWYSNLKLEINTPLPYSKNFGSDGNRTAVDIQLSQSNVEAQKDALQQTNNTVLAAISSAYWGLTKALGEVQIAQQQIDILAKMKKNISRQFQQREVTEYNYNQILTSYENALNQNELAWNNYLLASNQLAEQLNLPPELVLVPDLTEEHLLEPFDSLDVGDAVEYALERHPQRQFLQQKLFDKGLELRFYQNQNKPDISLDLAQQYNQDNSVMGYDSFSESVNNLFSPDIKDFYIGINYSYPIGNRANKAALSKARLAKKQAQLALENNDLELKVNIRDSINDLNNALARFQLSSRQLQVSQESYDKVEQYSSQRQASEFERLQSLQTLLNAQQNYIDDFIDRHLALTQLKAAKGEYACYNQSC